MPGLNDWGAGRNREQIQDQDREQERNNQSNNGSKALTDGDVDLDEIAMTLMGGRRPDTGRGV